MFKRSPTAIASRSSTGCSRRREAVCVCDFEAMLDLKQSTVSYHLKQLLDAGIVEREKRGSYAYFSLAPGALAHVCGLLGSLSQRRDRRGAA